MGTQRRPIEQFADQERAEAVAAVLQDAPEVAHCPRHQHGIRQEEEGTEHRPTDKQHHLTT